MRTVVTVEQAREHLRVTDEVASETIDLLIHAAEGVVADFLGRTLISADGAWPKAEAVPVNIAHAIKIVVSDLWEGRPTDVDLLRQLIGRYVVVGFA